MQLYSKIVEIYGKIIKTVEIYNFSENKEAMKRFSESDHLSQEDTPTGDKKESIGYKALVDQYNLCVIPHFRWSYIIQKGSRRALLDQSPHIYLYDQGYALDNPHHDFEQLTFALKHEGLNLEIITAFFGHISADQVTAHVQNHPTGKYERMIWYLYESITEQRLPLPNLEKGSYIDLLDDELYYTNKPIQQPRQRINDNLLGNFSFCPFVRKTDLLKSIQAQQLHLVVREMLKEYDPTVIERAGNFLYAQETMSSYQIERERPSKQRLARFIQLIKKSENISILTKQTLIELQNNIVEDRFTNREYRTTQNYVGQSKDWYQQIIHFISPRPEDVAELMDGLLQSLNRMLTSAQSPFAAAAAIAFGFVFIHPFDDGNGRLHRFLVHYILHRLGFTPPGIVFPISATILLDMHSYSQALEHFSKPLIGLITDYDLNEQGEIIVHQKTDHFYRFIDYTTQTEFLAQCIEKTIKTDFKDELSYLAHYDQAKEALQEIVDMPDRLINLFITVTSKNKGILSHNKRTNYFAMLTDDEIRQMETVIQQLFFK